MTVFKKLLFGIVFISLAVSASAQDLARLKFNEDSPFNPGLVVQQSGNSISFPDKLPFFTFKLNNKWYNLSNADISISEDDGHARTVQNLEIIWERDSILSGSLTYLVEFINLGQDTLRLSNVLPFGNRDDHPYITADGPSALARAKLFRPGCGPIDVTLPDNAWDLGYASVQLNQNVGITALARRYSVEKGSARRYSITLPPGASASYRIYLELYNGSWQQGLKKVFHEKYLYDLTKFDETLYRREDLSWMRNQYILTLQFAWDHRFYDLKTRKYNFYSFLEEGKKIFGGYDVFALWPTWPRLGLDERNQFDLYNNLPFGLPKLKELANYARFNGTHFFISYNPWDQSTRAMDHLKGMAALIKAIEADGVVLDTRGNSSWALQAAADSVRDGVIMYSEGMAVPGDMPGIIAGRVHDAIFMQPPLNLNKVIRPDFAIFRVCQMSEGRIHRELAISFLNGYGTEINTMAPGNVEGIDADLKYLGRTTRILRENTSAFLNDSLIPLIPVLTDSIWVNYWADGRKKIYTLFSLNSEGWNGPLFQVNPEPGRHFVSLWDHQELIPVARGEKWFLPVVVDPFSKTLLGTRMEGMNQCIASLPEVIRVTRSGDSLHIVVQEGNKLRIWTTNPSYNNTPLEYPAIPVSLDITEKFKSYTGPLIIQLFKGKELLDEKIIHLEPGLISKISEPQSTEPALNAPDGMLEIPAGVYVYKTVQDESFIPYPPTADSLVLNMPRYFMDQYPVTNEQFQQFILATSYMPTDTTNYLHHWANGTFGRGQGNLPVVWISPDDAKAYARWAGKRLPTEMEWQYAAQGTDNRRWPWGNDYHATKCNNSFGLPTPVDAFPKGKSPFKIEDLVGNVWQFTADDYDDGTYYFTIIRGGSYFNPTSSEWYVKGGPQPVNKRQILILVSDGFDRSSTIGFRCVKDAR